MRDPTAVPVLVRIWLPDRPGALGLVASRIGALRGDIVRVEVLDRDQGTAVDEIAVVVPDGALIEMLIQEIEEVDGVSVEEVRHVDAFGEPGPGALDGASVLVNSNGVEELHEALVDLLLRELAADWGALMGDGLLAGAGAPPPVDALRELIRAIETSTTRGDEMHADIGIAHLSMHEATVLVRRGNRPLRRRERAQLDALARIADRTWSLLTG